MMMTAVDGGRIHAAVFFAHVRPNMIVLINRGQFTARGYYAAGVITYEWKLHILAIGAEAPE